MDDCDSGPGWEQQEDNLAERWHEEDRKSLDEIYSFIGEPKETQQCLRRQNVRKPS